jgi:hypothetical protein
MKLELCGYGVYERYNGKICFCYILIVYSLYEGNNDYCVRIGRNIAI